MNVTWMKPRLSHFSVIVWICLTLIGTTQVRADVQFEGENTKPNTPAILKDFDFFEVGANGEALLRFPDSAYLRCQENTKGQILPTGIILHRGTTRCYLKKRGKRFFLETPCAIIGVRGTLFDLTVSSETTRVSLLQGQLKVSSRSDPKTTKLLEKGQVCVISKTDLQIRPIGTTDILDWYSQVYDARIGEASASFDSIFLTGAVTVNRGNATLISNNIERKLDCGDKIPVGGIIQSPKQDPVDISLGCGSGIRLAPSGKLKIGEFGIELLEGALLVRHTSQRFPLKVEGPSTLLVHGDSVGEIRKTTDSFQIRVHKGTVEISSTTEVLKEGQVAQVKGTTLTAGAGLMPSGTWVSTSPELTSHEPEGISSEASSLFDDSQSPVEEPDSPKTGPKTQDNTDLLDLLKP